MVIITDAVASRHEPDHDVALQRIDRTGGEIMTVELLLFDLLATADSPFFKAIQHLVK